jgi:mercuric ion transport protein
MTRQGKEPVSRTHPGNGSDTVKVVLAAGGLLAAFGVASCCALPVALSLLGISAVSLVGIGYLAAQYQQE